MTADAGRERLTSVAGIFAPIRQRIGKAPWQLNHGSLQARADYAGGGQQFC